MQNDENAIAFKLLNQLFYIFKKSYVIAIKVIIWYAIYTFTIQCSDCVFAAAWNCLRTC